MELIDKLWYGFYTVDGMVDSIFDWIRFRTINRNLLKINSLKPGYHDLDIKILHVMFDALTSFVEIELARNCFYYEGPTNKQYDSYTKTLTELGYPESKIPLVFKELETDYEKHLNETIIGKYWDKISNSVIPYWMKPYTRNEYLAVGGLCYGVDEVNVNHEEGMEEFFAEHSAQQKKILELYIWWKYIRPKRVDPDVASGWSYIFDRRYNSDWQLTEEDIDKEKTAIRKCGQIEKEYADEDDNRLAELCAIRCCLWT